MIVGNPDESLPDLTLTEVTWDGDNSTWIGEGVEVWAVNYNGTGEDRLVAYAYNKLAMTRATNAGAELLQVEGAKIEFAYQSDARNLYDTLVYFPDDFVYCTAIRLVDITESLKQYGGNGQDVHDGYDLDALYGYKILYIPVDGVEYQSETAIAAGNLNLNCEDSWQKVVMKVATSDLVDNNVVTFDIIAGQHYKVGTGEVYLDENGEVQVRYNFNASYNLVKVNDVSVGIYKDYNSMLKNGKLLGNGQLTNIDKVTLEDEYAYIRLHFDVDIPTYLIEEIEYVDDIAAVCEKVEDDEEAGCNKDKHHDKECKNNCHKHHDEDKECKEYHKECDKNCKKHDDKKEVKCNNKKDNKNNVKKTHFIKKTCNSVKNVFKKCFSR